MNLPATTWQTVGPYFKIGLHPLDRDQIAGPGVEGERVTIQGRVLDGDGQPVPDAVLETWQANALGKYAHPADTQDKPLDAGFMGFGRIPTDQDGAFRLSTIKPGPVPGPDGTTQAPHILVSVLMRGLLTRLVTRIYFPDDLRNEQDFVLGLVDRSRRSTLIARPVQGRKDLLQWNVVLQGEDETVFFDC